MKLLFIGNSHTYYHDLPYHVAQRIRELTGEMPDITMIAHGGWFLDQHLSEPDVRFNILYGNYNYVILQEHTHAFFPSRMVSACKVLCDMIHQANSIPVIYMTWAEKNHPENQTLLSGTCSSIAKENHALLAPVGEARWEYIAQSGDTNILFDTDGQHTSAAGIPIAADVIAHTILSHKGVLK